MTAIEQLASDLLDVRETQLAARLAIVLDDNAYDAESLLSEILPIYWQRVGNIDETLSPDNIYRPLYYVHMWSSLRHFKEITRAYMEVISGHLEGCLKNLLPVPIMRRASGPPFGTVLTQLEHSGILQAGIVHQLRRFNRAVNVASKHFDAYMPTRDLGQRTFSVSESSSAVVLMRQISIKLFAILGSNGVSLPQGWPPFKDEWLSWSKKVQV